LDYIKACDQQFTLTTKKSLHITFKVYDADKVYTGRPKERERLC